MIEMEREREEEKERGREIEIEIEREVYQFWYDTNHSHQFLIKTKHQDPFLN